MSLRESFVLLFIVGLAPGLIQLSHPIGLGLGPGREMAVLGKNLAQNGIYGDPFRSMKTGPTAMNPPLYPALLALFFGLFRDPLTATISILLANVIVNALMPALLPRISTLLWGTAAPGIAAGMLSILSAQLIPDWDADYTQLGLILFCLATIRIVRNYGYCIWKGTIAGVAAGALFLMSQVIALVALPWIGFMFIVRRASLREAARFLIALTLAAVVVNAPWLWRNYRIWGEWVTRTNFGVALYVSNNDCAEPSIYDEMANGCHEAMHPDTSVAEAALMVRMGEPAYERLKSKEAVAWMKSYPREFLRLSWMRFVQFWFPVPVPPRYANYMVWIITILSIPGFALMVVRRIKAVLFFGAVFVLYPLVYYIVISAIRYRVTVLWLSCLVAGYFLAAIPRWRAAGILADG